MMATGEAQTMAPQLDSLELARLLRRKLAGEPFPHSFIHDVEACSVAPEELVRGRAPGADQGDGKGMAWYFYGPVNCDGESAWRRRRHVGSGGGAGRRCWHPETGKRPILCPDKKSAVAYKRTLSYVLKIKNLPVKTKSFRNKRLGWCMIEISLKKRDDDGEDQLRVLCKVYKPSRTDPETSMEASSAGGQGVVPAAICAVSEGGVTQDESLDLPGSNTPLPTPASGDYNLHPPGVAPNPALFIGPGNDMPPPPPAASGHHSLHPLGPGVVQSPVISIGPAPQYGTQCWPGGKVLSRVAIVKKADVASCGAVTVVMKFGSSSIPSAERIKEMAKLVLNFPSEKGEIRAVVLSEMGNTTNNILMAVWKALRCGDKKASEIHEFFIIKELYLRTIDELGLHTSIVSGPLDKLEHHLQHVAITKELTPRTRDFLVSFGGHTCTEMFSAYLNKLGKGTPQEWELRVVTTSGSGSSDLTATTIGKTLGLRQIQVWKDVDGILTCDPKVNTMATLVPYLTFDEAAELSYFGEQSMQLAMEAGMSVIVKNSYKPQAAGTMITKTRDMSKSTSTIIVLKSNITMLDIVSISMLSRNDFVAKAFSIFQEFEDLGISVDFVAEGKMSFTLVPSKLLSQESIQLGLDNVVEELKKIASVELLHHRSVISMIGNTQMAALILHKAVNVLRSIKIEAQKVLQWSSKLVTKITLVVDDSEGEHCVQALHSALVELNDDVRVDSSMMAGSSSGSGSGVKKRKAAGDGHPGGSKGLLQENAYSTEPSTSVVGRPTVPGNDPIIPVEDIDDYDLQSLLATLSSPYNDQTPIGNLDWNFPLLYDDGAEALHSCVPLPAHISRPEMLRQIVVGDRHHDTTGTNYMTPEGTDRLFSPYNNPMPRRIRFDQKLDSMVLPQSGCNYGPSRVSTPEPEELFTPPEHPEVSLSIAGSLAKELFAAIRWLAGCWATCRERIGV